MRGQGGPLRLRHRVGDVLRRLGAWGRGDRVVVAVSGGLDSTVLLDVLVETRGWHGASLEVACIDHRHRPDGADEVARVGAWADTLGLPFHGLTLPAGPPSEDRLRRLRRQALRALGAPVIAMGHHQDDQVETVFVHLVRGARPTGMRWRNGPFVRPLLGERREALRAWAEHRRLTWVDDPTNADLGHLRNRLRATWLTELDTLRPGASASIANRVTPPLGEGARRA